MCWCKVWLDYQVGGACRVREVVSQILVVNRLRVYCWYKFAGLTITVLTEHMTSLHSGRRISAKDSQSVCVGGLNCIEDSAISSNGLAKARHGSNGKKH